MLFFGYFNSSTLFFFFYYLNIPANFTKIRIPKQQVFFTNVDRAWAEERSVMQVGKSFPELWKGYVFFLKRILPLFIRVKSSTSQLHLSPPCSVFPVALSPTRTTVQLAIPCHYSPLSLLLIRRFSLLCTSSEFCSWHSALFWMLFWFCA